MTVFFSICIAIAYILHTYFSMWYIEIPQFLIPIIVGSLIQLMKVSIDFFVSKHVSIRSLWVSWGFPSTHAWITSSICVLMFLFHGLESPEFALAFCFSFLFRYDAVNIRFEAGQHASYINKISEKLESAQNYTQDTIQRTRALKERLGHTFIEVIWWIIIGAWLTLLYYVL